MNSGKEDRNENSFDGMDFEWYPHKAAANLKKHQVSFDEAMTIFGDKMHVVFPDREHSYDEERFLAIGSSNKSRLLHGGWLRLGSEGCIKVNDLNQNHLFELLQHARGPVEVTVQ